MQTFPPTVILRHRKENLKKCSLRGLESREDFTFYTYPNTELPILSGYITLSLDAPPLTAEDNANGLLILDGTWRYADKMFKYVETTQHLEKRSIPPEWRTVYPRKQDDCPSPERGLASVEAIYAAYTILGRDTSGLLDTYFWKDQFLELNHSTP